MICLSTPAAPGMVRVTFADISCSASRSPVAEPGFDRTSFVPSIVQDSPDFRASKNLFSWSITAGAHILRVDAAGPKMMVPASRAKTPV